MITVDEFAQEAKQWLAENKHLAPRDYGAICPPDMVNEGLAWQKHLYASGKAGIHWPVDEHGKVVQKKKLKRKEMSTYFANLESCLIGIV